MAEQEVHPIIKMEQNFLAELAETVLKMAQALLLQAMAQAEAGVLGQHPQMTLYLAQAERGAGGYIYIEYGGSSGGGGTAGEFLTKTIVPPSNSVDVIVGKGGNTETGDGTGGISILAQAEQGAAPKETMAEWTKCPWRY